MALQIKGIPIKVTRRQVATAVLATALLLLNFTMRYGVWKQMQLYSLQKTQHEKLALAFHLGGYGGFDYELQILLKYNPESRGFLNETAYRIMHEKDPEAYLKGAMVVDRDRVKELKHKRFIVSSVIYAVVGLQLLFNARCWLKDNRHFFQKAPA